VCLCVLVLLFPDVKWCVVLGVSIILFFSHFVFFFFFFFFFFHVQDMFTAYTEECTKKKRESANDVAVFPVALSIVKCFREKNPILLGVDVVEGILKIGTPICVPAIKDEDGDPLMVGRITSIQDNHKEVQMCKKGKQVAVKIEAVETAPLTFGRQFDKNSSLYSYLTRQSIDALKENFKNDLERNDWKLVIQLKKMLDI
jgi:translation initiation factor 5B